MSTTERADGADGPPPKDPWVAAARSEEFATLRKRLRRFVFPMTALFLTWYFLYVVLGAFAPDFMSIRVAGNINVGLVFGLLQFVTTFAITVSYVRFANRHLDPVSSRIRAQIEEGVR
ncbi:MAG: DUF485 domain-containing protein [Pseudonocardiaceae bacterium]